MSRNAKASSLQRTLIGVSLAVALVASRGYAEPVSHPAGWGLGLMLGAPTGLTAKYWMGGPSAIRIVARPAMKRPARQAGHRPRVRRTPTA